VSWSAGGIRKGVVEGSAMLGGKAKRLIVDRHKKTRENKGKKMPPALELNCDRIKEKTKQKARFFWQETQINWKVTWADFRRGIMPVHGLP